MLKPQVLFTVDNEFDRCVRLKNQVETLIKSGIDCHVIDFQFGRKTGIRFREVSSVNVYTVCAPPLMQHFRTLSAEFPIFQWFVRNRLNKIIQLHDLNPIAVHCYNTFAWKGVFHCFSKKHKAKLIVDFAEDLPSIMREYDYVKHGIGRLLVNLGRWDKLQAHAVSNSDKCIVVTSKAASDYVKRYGVQKSKFLVIDNLPSIELIEESTREEYEEKDGFSLLYFGDTSVRRGTDLLIRTAPRIKSHIFDYQVIIVGHNNREQTKLESMIQQLGCSDYVSLEGFQPEIKLPKYMKRSSLGASPLKRNQHHDTTHANKLFQFMVGRLPLVVSDCTAQSDLVLNNNLGVVFEADNDESFIQTMIDVRSRHKERGLWSRNALEFTKKNNLTKVVAPYGNYLSAL